MNSKGIISQKVNVDTPGRIIRFQDDEYFNNGMLVLTDGDDDGADPSVRSLEYNEVCGCKLYMFPLQEFIDKRVTLNVLKQGKIYPLITSEPSRLPPI